MKNILKAFFLLIALTLAVPVFAQSDFEAIKARAEAGDALAQTLLAMIYFSGEMEQDVNYQEAAKWFLVASENGSSVAQFYYGIMHVRGDGVPKNDQEAVKWFSLSAESGYVEAQYHIALAYWNGSGVAQNHQEAVKWYGLAAEQGYDLAQRNLGIAYSEGLGITQSDQEAFRYFKLAAEQGDKESQTLLASMYALGRAVPQNDLRAYMWYSLSAANGYLPAAEGRDGVRSGLSPQALEEAQALATRCFESNFQDCD
jgi:TPR repeat protein